MRPVSSPSVCILHVRELGSVVSMVTLDLSGCLGNCLSRWELYLLEPQMPQTADDPLLMSVVALCSRSERTLRLLFVECTDLTTLPLLFTKPSHPKGHIFQAGFTERQERSAHQLKHFSFDCLAGKSDTGLILRAFQHFLSPVRSEWTSEPEAPPLITCTFLILGA